MFRIINQEPVDSLPISALDWRITICLLTQNNFVGAGMSPSNLYGSSIWDDNSNERKMIVVTQIMLFRRRGVSLHRTPRIPLISVYFAKSVTILGITSRFLTRLPLVSILYIHLVFKYQRLHPVI